ncbi:MAG: hypothetical protein AB1551_00415 [Actinomycetota bacterium]
MSEPPSSRRPESALAAGWETALVRGGLAFAVMALLGQAAALAVFLVERRYLSGATAARLGWFYFGWFHHVSATASLRSSTFETLGAPVELSTHLGVALIAMAVLAAFLLFRAGRAVAERVGGGVLARTLHGAKVAPAYAVPSFVLSLVVAGRIAVPALDRFGGYVQVRSSPAQALVFPLLIAVAAGAAGGYSSAGAHIETGPPLHRRLAGALAGGVRMLALGLLLSFAGLLVLAVAKPDSTKAYFDTVTRGSTAETTLLIGHHVLLLPNQSMWVLVPAMGGCDEIRGPGGSSPFLCYWRYPRSVSVSANLLTGVHATAPFKTVPSWYFLFLLVPLLSVLGGGRTAAERAGARDPREAMTVGAAAGAVFAALVVGAALLSSLSVGLSAGYRGLSTGGTIRMGPSAMTGGLLALVWGVAGGAVGAWWQARESPREAAGEAVPVQD